MRLVSWIGHADIEAVAQQSPQLGAIASTLKNVTFSEAHLLNNYTDYRVPAYLSWLADNTECALTSRLVSLSSPIDFHDIYIAADRLLTELATVSSKPIAVLLTSWKDAPEGKIQKFDVVVAKNYLNENEMAQLQRWFQLI